MREKRTYRYAAAFLLLFGLTLLFLILNGCIGSVGIPLSEIGRILFGRSADETAARILWDIRLPRAAADLILGGALALAGYLLQTFFHNPIAGPFVLGISSGAKMAVALVMIFFLGRSARVTSASLILAAFAGAMLCRGG